MKHIRKIGLLVVRGGKLLLVRKRGGTLFILPGGKPEGNETDTEALKREIREELGCSMVTFQYLMEVKAPAADLNGVSVTVVCYLGEINEAPRPLEEIEEIRWVDINTPDVPLAVSISEQILPALQDHFA